MIDSLDYLVQIVSHIIYIAGPLHASINYAQYPLMSFSPSVSGCIYNPQQRQCRHIRPLQIVEEEHERSFR